MSSTPQKPARRRVRWASFLLLVLGATPVMAQSRSAVMRVVYPPEDVVVVAEQPSRRGAAGEETLRDRGLVLDLGVLNASLSYAFPTSAGTAVGLSAGFGAQLGVMVAADEFSIGDYGADRFFAEVAHGAVFIRHQLSERVHVEGGPRVSWMYHPPTERETMFYAAYGAAFVRVAMLRLGMLSLGTRLQLGRLAGSGNRRAWNVGLVPIAGRIALRW